MYSCPLSNKFTRISRNQAQIQALLEQRDRLHERRSLILQQITGDTSFLENDLIVLSDDEIVQPDESFNKEFEWTPRLKLLAEKHWRITSFRNRQEEIMNAFLSKRDVFVIMPTGGGSFEM